MPAGVTQVTVEGWGGGGSGGAADSGNGGGGGGGGAYSRKLITGLTPGASISYNVGAGGASKGIENSGDAGGDTWFSSTAVFLAKGGGAGTIPSGGAGSGGAAASGVGDTKFSGGNGAGGLGSNGGGGGAGDANNGGNASGGTGGSGGSANGGQGGNAGVGGSVRGGGGGGASDAVGSSGAGARGELRITYATVHSATVVLATTATLGLLATANYKGNAALTATATLTPVAIANYKATAALAASATISPNGGKFYNVAATLTATATLSPTGTGLRAGAALLASTAAMTPAPRITYGGIALLAATGILAGLATVTSVLLEGRQPKNVIFHVYTAAGVVIRAWPDVSNYPEFDWPINGGPGAMVVKLPRPWGAAGEPGEVGSAGDIQHGNIVKVYVFDRDTAIDGYLIWQGVIENTVCNLAGEVFEVTMIPKTTQMADLVVREPIIWEDMDPTDMVEWLIDNLYLPDITFDPTNPLVGLTFDLTFQDGKVSTLLDIIRGLAGGRWYLRLNSDNSLTFNEWDPKVATHSLVIGKHVADDVVFERSSLEVKKRVYVYGTAGIVGSAVEPGYDSNVAAFDLALVNSRVNSGTLANRLAASLLELKQPPTIATEFTVIDNTLDLVAGYDLELIMPGHTIALINPSDVFEFGKWDDGDKWGAAGKWGGSWNQQVQHAFVVVHVHYGFTWLRVKLASLPLGLPAEMVNLQDAVFLTGSSS